MNTNITAMSNVSVKNSHWIYMYRVLQTAETLYNINQRFMYRVLQTAETLIH